MSSAHSFLHPDAKSFLELLDKPSNPPFHLLTTAQQRSASEKMMRAFSPPPPAVASVRDLVLERPEAAGGGLQARLFRPLDTAPDAVLPALLWFHGGGWTLGNIDSYDVLCRQLANLAQCAVLAVAYRLAPEHPFPAGIDDAFFALQWLQSKAPDLAIDGARLAVGGDSAGGNLAIVTALRARDAGIGGLRLQLLVYPATDQRGITDSHSRYGDGYLLTQDSIRMFQRGYLPRLDDFTDWRASPILAPTLAGLPPVLLITASHDPIVDDCHAFAARLEAAGVATERLDYAGMVHGFFTLGKAFGPAQEAVARAGQALRAALVARAGGVTGAASPAPSL